MFGCVQGFMFESGGPYEPLLMDAELVYKYMGESMYVGVCVYIKPLTPKSPKIARC